MVQRASPRHLANNEKIRIENHLNILERAIEGARIAIRASSSSAIGYDTSQGLLSCVNLVVTAIARHDAFMQAAEALEKDRGDDGSR